MTPEEKNTTHESETENSQLKAKESHTKLEFFLLVICAPLLIGDLRNIPAWNIDKSYKRKRKESWLALLLGLLLWFLICYALLIVFT